MGGTPLQVLRPRVSDEGCVHHKYIGVRTYLLHAVMA